MIFFTEDDGRVKRCCKEEVATCPEGYDGLPIRFVGYSKSDEQDRPLNDDSNCEIYADYSIDQNESSVTELKFNSSNSGGHCYITDRYYNANENYFNNSLEAFYDDFLAYYANGSSCQMIIGGAPYDPSGGVGY